MRMPLPLAKSIAEASVSVGEPDVIVPVVLLPLPDAVGVRMDVVFGAEIVTGLVPVNRIPLPAAIEPDATATHEVRLPLLSKHAPIFWREASAGSNASVSPGR